MPPQKPEGQPLPPPLQITTGTVGDKCVIQVITTHIVEPAYMRQVGEMFAQAASDAERSVVVVGPGPLIMPGQ